MKILKSFTVLVLLMFLFVGCGSNKEKLYIINWGEYMDQELISQFEEEYNVDVVYEEVDSNEAMYTKIKNGSSAYDVAIPSDYMIEKMINEELLNKIDYSEMENNANIDPKYYGLTTFDTAGEYYVPYFTGTVGIMYNTDLVDEKDLTGWDVLWNKKYSDSAYLYDSIRDTMSVGALYNGYSINTTDPKELEQIEKDLTELSGKVQGYGTDDLKNLIAAGDGSMAVVYSGDYLVTYQDMVDNDIDLNVGYFIPNEGTNVWVDGMVIPTTSKNSEMANKFIDFMLDGDNAKQNSEWVGYTTTNLVAFDLLVGTNPIYDTEAYVIPQEKFDNSEVYVDLGQDGNETYSEIYIRIKNG